MGGDFSPHLNEARRLQARCQLAHILAQQGDETRFRQAAADIAKYVRMTLHAELPYSAEGAILAVDTT